VLLAEVVGVDLESRSVDANGPGIGIKKIGFDYLVVAAGMQSSYFGHDEFAEHAPCLKTITDAETIRSKILSAYELAESTDDADERQRQMTFVLVGAGPTGVELAASIAQLATTTLRRNFRRIDPATTTILLDGAKRILPSFAESLSKKAAKRLAKLGVQVVTDTMVEVIDDRGVTVGGNALLKVPVPRAFALHRSDQSIEHRCTSAVYLTSAELFACNRLSFWDVSGSTNLGAQERTRTFTACTAGT
jgi:NADH:ubiquinone reductase (H+-translocating)